MAQARVTEFFSSRKRTADSQPSKRRKVVILSSDVETLPVQNTNVRSTRASAKVEAITDQLQDQLQKVDTPKPTTRGKADKKTKPPTTRKGRKVNTPTLVHEKNQSSIKDAFEKASRSSTPSEEISTGEEITSAWDEHDGVSVTPSKRPKETSDSSDTEKTDTIKKRTRKGKGKSAVKEQANTPEKDNHNEEPVTQKSRQSRKKLVLNSVQGCPSDSDNTVTNVVVQGPKKEDAKLSPIATPPAISPIPETPEVVRRQLKKGPSKPTSKKVKDAMALVKMLKDTPITTEKESKTAYKADMNITSDNIKQKLSKVGGLEDLKLRLVEMSQTKASLKQEVPKLKKFDKAEIEVPSEPPKEIAKKVPAYEKFHALATPAPPTLTMPYKYRMLGEMFRSMDTIVSMLHNRNECCTFSKLKTAVQTMTKRNFEEKNAGQVKTVYPSAYTFRQQKGLPEFGNKTSGYQLTVEANLTEDEKVKQEKQNFSAKHLLDRRCTFNNKLISIVKRHHKAFLAKLDPPMSIPDDKITRWHPKFPVDEVPDVEVSELPKPPVIHKYQSAKDVLEARRGQLIPKVEQALEKVALSSPAKTIKSENTPSLSNSTTSITGVQYKGIPQSLLDKIRAKESKKLEMAMTRNPAEDKRMQMMQKLPDLMRMLRSHFITEKKPALLLENVVQKLGDSSRSFIPLASLENHVMLMIEILPKWLTLVEIRKGKYLKMDKNLDLQVLIEQVNSHMKRKGE